VGGRIGRAGVVNRAGVRCALRRSFGGVLGAARDLARIEARGKDRAAARDEAETGPGMRPGYVQDMVHPEGPRSAAAGASRGDRAVEIPSRAGRVSVLVRAQI